MSEQDGKQYLTKKETADFLGVEERTVDRYVEQGRLQRYKQGGGLRPRVFFLRSDVERLEREQNQIVPDDGKQ